MKQELATVDLAPSRWLVVRLLVVELFPDVREHTLHDSRPCAALDDRVWAVVHQRLHEERRHLSVCSRIEHAVLDAFEDADSFLESCLREVVLLPALLKVLGRVVMHVWTDLPKDLDSCSIRSLSW